MTSKAYEGELKMLFIINRLSHSAQSLSDPRLRQKYGALSGAVGIALNILLFAIKLFAALVSGSVGVIADAFNNLSDAVSSVVTLVGFRISARKPDAEHPFGHVRAEYITGFIVSAMILMMGFELAQSSIRGISNPEELEFSSRVVIILSVSMAVKLYMALYNYRLCKLFDSAALKATSKDSIMDALSTFTVLIAGIVSQHTGVQLDAWAGLLVSLFIIYTGISSARDTLSPLLGSPPKPELVAAIEKLVLSEENIIALHDLVVHDYGPGRVMVSLHAEMPSELDVFVSHDIIDNMELLLERELGCEAVIHYDPIDINDEQTQALRRQVEELVKQVDPRLTIHDFRYTHGETHSNLMYDVVVPFEIKKSDEELKSEIFSRVFSALPNHRSIIKFDRPMS
jgi:cation diffusion facilitator family transporter